METIEFTTKETQLVKIEPTQLEEIVKNSGLAIQEGEEIKKSYLPFLMQLSEAQSQASKINFQNPGDLDENIARELRLKTVKIRTGAEKLKDERKRMYLLRGNLEQASFNLIAASCKLTEEVFFNVEKAREIAEKKHKEELRKSRAEKLSPYTEDADLYPLGEMSEQQFEDLYSGLRIAQENKQAAEKEAEEERIEKERIEKLHADRINSIRSLWQFMDTPQSCLHLGELTEGKWNDLIKSLNQKKADYEAEQERIRKENDRLARENEKKQKELEAEKEKAKKEQEEKDGQIAKEKADAQREKEKREKLEAKIQAEKDAEKKAKQDAERKRKADEKAARLAPDKTKLLNFCQAINDLPRPEVKSIEAADIASKANILLVKTVNFIKENAEKL